MLYQPTPQSRVGAIVRQVGVLIANLIGAMLAFIVKAGADRRYLDGMRDSELEDLNLRRTETGDYRPLE